MGSIQTIAVENPLPGTWRVNVNGGRGENNEINLFHFANKPAPEVDLEVIGSSPMTETTATINWNSNVDPSSNMRISLYYELSLG